MRVATLIIGLMLVIGLFLQSVLVGGLSEVAGDDDSSSAAAVGVLMALMWIFGCALVIPLPRLAMIIFGLAGVLGFAVSGTFPDLGVWGGISLVLALFSYFGWRGKRKADRRERERDALIRQAAGAQLMTAQSTAYMAEGLGGGRFDTAPTPAAIPATRTCGSCGGSSAPSARFCADCGQSFTPAPA